MVQIREYNLCGVSNSSKAVWSVRRLDSLLLLSAVSVELTVSAEATPQLGSYGFCCRGRVGECKFRQRL